MRPASSFYLYEGDVRFFGEGPYDLLKEIEKTGSLRSAAKNMNLSYSKSLAMMKRAESALGFTLAERNIGGKGGGGSTLTDEAKDFMEKYRLYREKCRIATEEIFKEIF